MLLCYESVRLGAWLEAWRLSALAFRTLPWMTLDGPEVWPGGRSGLVPLAQDGAVGGGTPLPSGLHGAAEKLSCSRAGLAGQGILPLWVSKVGSCQQGTSHSCKNAKTCSSASRRVPVLSPCIHLMGARVPQLMVAFLWELSLQLLWGN